MTTASIAARFTTDSYPLLVSELPPTAGEPTTHRRVTLADRRRARRDAVRFEDLLRSTSPAERNDLLHAARRAS